MMTVKMGAELFTVSANDTATFFRLTKPRTTVVNLQVETMMASVLNLQQQSRIISYQAALIKNTKFSMRSVFLSNACIQSVINLHIYRIANNLTS